MVRKSDLLRSLIEVLDPTPGRRAPVPIAEEGRCSQSQWSKRRASRGSRAQTVLADLVRVAKVVHLNLLLSARSRTDSAPLVL